METHFDRCPICRNELKDITVRTDDYANSYHVNCQYCGRFQLFGWKIVSRYDLKRNSSSLRKSPDPILSIGIRMEFERTRSEVVVDAVSIQKIKDSVVIPDNAFDKVEVLLLYLQSRNHDISKSFVMPIADYPLVFARSISELYAIFAVATNEKLIKLVDHDIKTLIKCEITAKGWKMIKEKQGEPTYNKLVSPTPLKKPKSIKCFIVHGHDKWKQNELKRFLVTMGITPILLSELPSMGKTILEKFEHYVHDVDFTICLWTGDDMGCMKKEKNDKNKLQPRVRQNVMLETGYFWGRIQRNKVIILYETGVEIPSDFSGLTYINWKPRKWQEILKNEINSMSFN